MYGYFFRSITLFPVLLSLSISFKTYVLYDVLLKKTKNIESQSQIQRKYSKIMYHETLQIDIFLSKKKESNTKVKDKVKVAVNI